MTGGGYFLKLFSGSGIWWFLPCFFFGEILFFIIQKSIPNLSLQILVSFIFFFIGILLSRKGFLDVLSINTSLVVQFYFVIGATYKENEEYLSSLKLYIPVIILLLFIILCIISIQCYPNMVIDVHMNHYFDIPFNIICIVVGLFASFTIFSRINKYPQWLLFIGQNTLIIYMLHIWVILLFSKLVFPKFNFTISNPWVEAAALTIISLLFCCMACVFINRYIPFLAGKKRTIRN